MRNRNRQIYIPCWRWFLEDLIQRGNEMENAESAIELQVGDVLVFYQFDQPKNVITRSVNCRLSDGRYTIQNQKLHFPTWDKQGKKQYSVQRIKPLILKKAK